jgi:hypothetical protein
MRRWCFTCVRGSAVSAIEALHHFLDRGWSFDLQSARLRYPCRICRTADDVLLLPASPPPPPPLPSSTGTGRTWQQETEAFFHGLWAQKKRRRNDHLGPSSEALMRPLAERDRKR